MKYILFERDVKIDGETETHQTIDLIAYVEANINRPDRTYKVAQDLATLSYKDKLKQFKSRFIAKAS